jgi:hypothetical protein
MDGAETGRERGRDERGFLMAAAIAAVAILLIFSTLALQEWADVLRRDNEAEMMFRAKDIVRAIQRYRRDHGGAGPAKLEQLMEPGPRGQYYLRKLWKDPLVRDGKWGLLYAGPAGQVVDPNATELDQGLTPVPGASGFGGTSPFGSGGLGTPPPGSGAEGGATGGPGGAPAPPGAAAFAEASESQLDANAGGKQLSGLPIAGVKSLSTDKPFRVYNGLTEYSQWLFSYFDLEQQQLPGNPGMNPPGMGGGGLGDGRVGPGRGPGFGKGRGARPGSPSLPGPPGTPGSPGTPGTPGSRRR